MPGTGSSPLATDDWEPRTGAEMRPDRRSIPQTATMVSRRSMPSTESYKLLLAAAAACADKKAEDIRILALDPAESGLTDYFLICNGTNERQNVAIVDEIELRLKRDFKTYPNSVEGRRQVPERYVFMGRSFDLPRTNHSPAVTVQQHPHHHRRVVGRHSSSILTSVDRHDLGQVQFV